MIAKISYSPDEWRTARWMVRHYCNRKPVCSFFTTKEEAEQHCRSINKLFKKGADEDDVIEALRIIAGTGYKLVPLVRSGLGYITSTAAHSANFKMTFAEAATAVVERATKRGARNKTIESYKSVYRRMNAKFGPSIAVTISEADFNNYLDMLPNKKGVLGAAEPQTKQNALRMARMALTIVGVNKPLAKIILPQHKGREIKFFSNEQVVVILRSANDDERGLIALALFSAIRPETLERLPASCVCVEDRIIRIPGPLSKDGKAHALETDVVEEDGRIAGVPSMLWEWLKKYPFKPRPWTVIQRRLKIALGGFWIQDGLRHTGATNYRNLYGYHSLADLLTHGGLTLLRSHYVGMTTKSSARAFYALIPSQMNLPSNSISEGSGKVVWPPDTELAEMLANKPAQKVGAMLGCSGSAVAKHCKLHGIAKPGRGYWAKRAAQSDAANEDAP